MRCLSSAMMILVLPAAALAGDTTVKAPDVNNAIDRGLKFLVKDARAWKEKHNCVSCHHASLPIWAMREAKDRGHSVDEPFLAEFTKWVAESGEGKTVVKRPDGIPKAFNTKAVYFAHAIGAIPQPDAGTQQGLGRFLKTVQEDQLENGAWAAWPETRLPIFAQTDDVSTILATLALTPQGKMDDAAAIAARDKGVQWLVAHPPGDDPQGTALRVVLWKRLGRPADECRLLVRKIIARQNIDGGFSQAPEMSSDAWATGQALYALAHAGVSPGDPTIQRAHVFLMKAQREDGAWPMTSRPIKPGGKGSTSLIPITGGGSAWGVLGLVRSLPPR